MKKVIYTCITGKYDKIIDSHILPKDVDLVCFTNQKQVPNIYKHVLIDIKDCGEAKTNRFYKLLPHRFLKNYDASIYIDGNMQVVGDINLLFEQLSFSNLINFSHPDRTCLYEELKACIRFKKDEPLIMQKQIQKYKDEDYPVNNGLLRCGVLIRKHNEEDSIKTMEVWWENVLKFSKRDTLSLKHALWKTKMENAVIDVKTFKNYFKIHKHIKK